jgi:hypothetical protein
MGKLSMAVSFVATLGWNAFNQPVSVGSTTAIYDALGSRSKPAWSSLATKWLITSIDPGKVAIAVYAPAYQIRFSRSSFDRK